MTSNGRLVTIRYGDYGISRDKYSVNVPNEILSKSVANCGFINAFVPYTKGTEDIYTNFVCHIVRDLRDINRGGHEAINATWSLKVEMKMAKLYLNAEDIDRIMHTIRNLLTDEAWEKIKTDFLDFIRYKYCRPFFDKVCNPTKKTYRTLLEDDLFTGYQYMSGRSSAIADTVRSIIRQNPLDTDAMFSDICFLRYYVNERPYFGIESFVEGCIICSFCQINTT